MSLQHTYYYYYLFVTRNSITLYRILNTETSKSKTDRRLLSHFFFHDHISYALFFFPCSSTSLEVSLKFVVSEFHTLISSRLIAGYPASTFRLFRSSNRSVCHFSTLLPTKAPVDPKITRFQGPVLNYI